MLQLTTAHDLTQLLNQERQRGHSIGFVPTMGALHEGHLTLIEQSKKENNLTVCSIFVNPLQFNNRRDLDLYPRNLAGDLKALKSKQCDIAFYPDYQQIYPANQRMDIPDLGYLETILEGAYRPGHFRGVAFVVRRLFDIVSPHCAYFGKKDYQQFLIIKKLAADLSLPIKIIGCDTVRTPEGLAMSSRNARLDNQGRHRALILFKSLQAAREMLREYSVAEITAHVKDLFHQTAPDCRLEYFEIADAETLLPIEDRHDYSVIIACIAAYVDGVRLIDNLILFP